MSKEDQFLEKQKAEREAELKNLGKVSPETKEVVNNSLRDKAVSTEQSFTKKGEKEAGVSGGYIATETETGKTFILKQFNKSKEDSNKIEGESARYQSLSDREDGARELVGASMYQFLLHDRAPKVGLVNGKDSNSLFVRSKFFEEVVSMPEFSGSKNEALNTRSDKLKSVEGFEKVIAACNMLGENDYHAGNIMVQKQKDADGAEKHVFTKIDHGKSLLVFPPDFNSLVKNLHDSFANFGYDQAIFKGNLSFDVKKYSEALKQMGNQLNEKQIDSIVGQKVAELQKAGFDFREFDIDQTKKLSSDPKFAREEFSEHFKVQLKQNLNNMKQISQQIEIVEKFTGVDEKFKKGFWVEAIAESGCKDPIEFAAKKGIKIEGKDPVVWAYNNGQKIDGKDPIAFAANNKIKIEGKDPIEFAAKKGIKIEGKDPVAFAAENGISINSSTLLTHKLVNKPLENLKRTKEGIKQNLNYFKEEFKARATPETPAKADISQLQAPSRPETPAPKSKPSNPALQEQKPEVSKLAWSSVRPNKATSVSQEQSAPPEQKPGIPKPEVQKPGVTKPAWMVEKATKPNAREDAHNLARDIGAKLDQHGLAHPQGGGHTAPMQRPTGKNQNPGRQ